MKKKLLILSALFISMTVFAQKDELKAADNAIDDGDFATAMTEIKNAEGLIDGADQKTKAKFYYLKALALYENGANEDIETVNNAFSTLIKYEKETKAKYTAEIKGLKANLLQATANRASDLYKTASQTLTDEDFGKAAKAFYNVYKLSPTDTLYLDNAALIYNKAKDYESAAKLYTQLLDIGYTGIATEYIATNKADGKDIGFPDKKAMNVQVKLGIVENPREELKESRRSMIYNYLAQSYSELGELDKALEVLIKGRVEFPKDYNLLITQANVHFKKDEKNEFKELLEEAINLNPTDASLYYNVGVMNMDQKNIDEAIGNFKKAIELDPSFSAAYQNIGTAIIEKTIPIVEEMNKSLSDFDKYDKLFAQQKEIYKEALPYYEKAYELDSANIGVIQTLLGLYENLEMTDKLEEIKAVYEKVKE